MKFEYTARTKQGELQTGNVQAASREAALNILAQHELFVLEIVGKDAEHWYDRFLSYFSKVKTKDLVIFSRQFATLLESKVPLSDSLRTLYKQTSSDRLKEVIFEISSDIEAGLSLSQALDRHPEVFSEFYVNMIRSAEVTGRMDEVMVFLADYLEKEFSLQMRVRNALIYPVIVIVLFIIVSIIMIVVVLPSITPIFDEAHVSLPFFTQVLIGFSNFIIRWWWALIFFFGVITVFLLDYLKTSEGKAVIDEMILKIPMVGDMLKKLYVARLAESISVLLKGGIRATQAIEITSHTIGNAVYLDLLHDVAERINAGELMSQAFGHGELFFPPILCQMTAVGEQTGRLDEVLKKVSAFYTQEVDRLVSGLVEFIQPLLMVGIGALVGLLFAAILLPMYDLAKVI